MVSLVNSIKYSQKVLFQSYTNFFSKNGEVIITGHYNPKLEHDKDILKITNLYPSGT